MSDITISRPKAIWESKNYFLDNGQYGIEDETGKVKVGDGVKHWNALPYLNVAPYTLPDAPSANTSSGLKLTENADGTFEIS